MNVRLLQTPNYAVAVTEKADAVIVTLEGTGEFVHQAGHAAITELESRGFVADWLGNPSRQRGRCPRYEAAGAVIGEVPF